MKAETKYKGSIKLSAIGDALGWITEFEKSSKTLEKKYGVDYINAFYNWEKNVGGRFLGYTDKIEKGSYSDDTQLMLSVARSIKSDGIVDRDYFSKVELPSWLLYSRGAGRTIKNAARKITRKNAKWNKNFFSFKIKDKTVDYRESGANGAAMRILPIALANFGDIEKIKKEIFANSIVTHGHPRAIIGAMLYGYAIDTMLRFKPENFNYINYITELGKDIQEKLSIPFIREHDFNSWVNEWNSNSKIPFNELYHEILNETQEYLRIAYKLIHKNISDQKALENLGCFDENTKGSGTSTVIAGIFLACKYSDKPIKAIESAVNAFGSDTDSIAAFSGGLIGALHGQSIIPQKWKLVQDYEYLEKIAVSLLEISESRANFKLNKPSKEYKFLNLIENDSFAENDIIEFFPLGMGKIIEIRRQDALTKGKYNLILHVNFNIGQSCVFSKLFDVNETKTLNLFENKQNSKKVNFEFINDSKIKERVLKFYETLNKDLKEEFLNIIQSLNNDI